MMKNLTTAIAFVLLSTVSSACSSQPVLSIELTDYCKQLISDVMGRDPGSISTDKVSMDIVSIIYIREDDAKEFTYQCKEKDGGII